MTQEGVPLPKSLRDRIVQNDSLDSIIEAGMSHQQVLFELEDMLGDRYAYNRVEALAQAGTESETA